MASIFNGFGLRFGSQVGAMLATFFPSRRPKGLPRRPQNAHKTPQDAPKAPQDAPRRPKTPPGRPQDAPKAPKSTSRQRFWDDFREILEDFWKSFGRIFSKILPSNLPPLLKDFRFASLFCVRLFVQRSPAVLPLCGLNTAGEPASIQPCQGFGYMAI